MSDRVIVGAFGDVAGERLRLIQYKCFSAYETRTSEGYVLRATTGGTYSPRKHWQNMQLVRELGDKLEAERG